MVIWRLEIGIRCNLQALMLREVIFYSFLRYETLEKDAVAQRPTCVAQGGPTFTRRRVVPADAQVQGADERPSDGVRVH